MVYCSHTTKGTTMNEPNPSGLCMCGCGQKTSLAQISNKKLGYVKGKPVRYVLGHNGKTPPPLQPPNPSGICMCGCGNPAPIARQSSKPNGYLKGHAMKYIKGHGRRNHPDKYVIDPDTGCWVWMWSVTSLGRPQMYDGGKMRAPHRVFYERTNDVVLDRDIDLHHTCLNHLCINPSHMLPLTQHDHRALHHELHVQKISKIQKEIS